MLREALETKELEWGTSESQLASFAPKESLLGEIEQHFNRFQALLLQLYAFIIDTVFTDIRISTTWFLKDALFIGVVLFSTPSENSPDFLEDAHSRAATQEHIFPWKDPSEHRILDLADIPLSTVNRILYGGQ